MKTFEELPQAVESISQQIKELRDYVEKRETNTELTIFSVKEAAKFLSISPQTIYQGIKNIPHSKKFGKLYFSKNDLIEYIGFRNLNGSKNGK